MHYTLTYSNVGEVCGCVSTGRSLFSVNVETICYQEAYVALSYNGSGIYECIYN